jgi:hypothetical protein
MIPKTTMDYTEGPGGVMLRDGNSSAMGSSSLDFTNLWIIFGIRNRALTSDIETILVFDRLDDSAFFSQLKAAHRKYRWWFTRWLSPYRFRNCRFAQVCFGYVSCRGNQRDHLTDSLPFIV